MPELHRVAVSTLHTLLSNSNDFFKLLVGVEKLSGTFYGFGTVLENKGIVPIIIGVLETGKCDIEEALKILLLTIKIRD